MNTANNTHGPRIDTSEAVDAARRGILDYSLDKDPAVASAVKGGHPGTPLLVERLDRPGDAYYLVPWRIKEGVVFIVEVDAATGAMLASSTFPNPIPSPFLLPEDAAHCAAREFPQYTLGEPRLVWKPCRESTSSMRPFYQIPFDHGFLYVDMEGSTLLELTPLGLGGTH
ncbi:MAG: PepSY domain-containing protein [Theionarchaea archaeon]|nr:PepSY domain-containing protein [Theionarchaea archaeon]